MRGPHRRQLRQDALPHPVHVQPHGAHLQRAARFQLVLEVALGHLAGVRGEPGQRQDRRPPQAEREHEHDDQQHDRDADDGRVQHRGGVVQRRDGLPPLRGEVVLQAGQRGPQPVEVRLALVDRGARLRAFRWHVTWLIVGTA